MYKIFKNSISVITIMALAVTMCFVPGMLDSNGVYAADASKNKIIAPAKVKVNQRSHCL